MKSTKQFHPFYPFHRQLALLAVTRFSAVSSVPVVEGYPGSPRFAAPASMYEIPEGLHESREPTIAQLLQEKALFSFSEWPKVRSALPQPDRDASWAAIFF